MQEVEPSSATTILDWGVIDEDELTNDNEEFEDTTNRNQDQLLAWQRDYHRYTFSPPATLLSTYNIYPYCENVEPITINGSCSPFQAEPDDDEEQDEEVDTNDQANGDEDDIEEEEPVEESLSSETSEACLPPTEDAEPPPSDALNEKEEIS